MGRRTSALQPDGQLAYAYAKRGQVLLAEQWAAMNPEVKVVSCHPGWVDTPEYTAETGWIDKAKIEKYCFPPAEDTLLFVCGLPPMYEALCGPRTEKAIKEGSVLHQLGYTADMVAKM